MRSAWEAGLPGREGWLAAGGWLEAGRWLAGGGWLEAGGRLAGDGRPPMKSTQSVWTGDHRRSKSAARRVARSRRSPRYQCRGAWPWRNSGGTKVTSGRQDQLACWEHGKRVRRSGRQ